MHRISRLDLLTSFESFSRATLFFTLIILSLSSIVFSACPSGIVSYWKMDENGGTTVYDYLGLNNGTSYGGQSWVAGKIGTALYFDGYNDYVEVPTSSSLQSPAQTNQLTIAGWIYLQSTPSAETYIVSHNYRFYELRIGAWGDRVLRAYLGNGTNYGDYSSDYTIPLNTWQFVTLTANGTNISFYINGSLIKTLPQTVPLGVYNTPLHIGARSPIEWNYYNGIIDEVAIFNRSLSASEIQQLYQNSLNGYGYCQQPGPQINFVSPTPANNSVITTNYTEINSTIDTSALDTFKFSWLSSLPGWSYAKSIKISNPGSELTDYQIQIQLSSSNFDFSKANSDGSDIRFYLQNGTKLNYWIEYWNSSSQSAIIWVKVPSIPSGDSRIIMYYGNPSATSESCQECMPRILNHDFEKGFISPASACGVNYDDNIPDWTVINRNGWSAYVTDSPGNKDGGCDFAFMPSGKQGIYYAASGDSATGTWRSSKFTLMRGVDRIKFLRAGGADNGGVRVIRASDGAVLCSAQTGTDTDTFFVDNCTGLSNYAGTIVYIEVWDSVSGGWGKVAVDNFHQADSNGNIIDYASPEPTVSIESDSYSIYDSSLVLAMNFNNNSAIGENATKAVDISKYGNNGTLMNGVAWTQNGRFGSALSFDGVNDYLISAYSNMPSGNAPRTMEAWIKVNAFSGGDGTWQVPVSSGICDTDRLFEILINNGGTIHWHVWGTYPSFATITTNRWYHVALTYDGSTIRAYLDGVLKDATVKSINTAQTALTIGGSCTQTYRNFNGLIDEVRIYNRALSADEIKMHYQSEFQKYNSTQYRFYVNVTNLTQGTYTYYAWANDSAGQSGQSEVRTLNVSVSGPLVQCPSGMVSYWKFDEGSGSSAIDYMGINNGTLLNGPTWTTGKVGNALSFDGYNDYVEVPYSTSLKMTDAVTLSAWIYFNGLPGSSCWNVVSDHSPSYNNGKILRMCNSRIEFLLGPAGTETAYYTFTTQDIGKWFFVTATYNKTEGLMKMYVNGELKHTVSRTGDITVNPNPIWIGKSGWGEYYNGIIDEVAIFNRALSASEIQQLYQNSLNGYGYCQQPGAYINFVPPTPANGSTITNNYTEINSTIDITNASANLDTFKFNWNNINYSIYDPSLVLAMNFNNNSAIGENATNVVDISRYGNNGTIYGGATYVDGRFGKALSFDGSSGKVVVPDSPSIRPTYNYSFEFWIQPKVWSSYNQVPFTKKRSGGSVFETIWIGSGYSPPKAFLCSFTNNTGNGVGVVTPFTLNENQWYHIICTYNGSQITMYVNGQQVASTPFSGMLADSTGGDLGIGYSSYWNWNYFNGLIDEVRIYNRALSADEVKMHYQSEFQKYNSTQYRFYVNVTNLTQGTYTYYTWANNTGGLSGQSETRTLNVGGNPPIVNFTSPTPANNSVITTNYTEINSTIDTSALDTFKFSWLSSLPGWSYDKPIKISNPGSELTDYQIQIQLSSSNFDFSKANSDGSDIRFYLQNGTKLNYWIEYWNSSSQSAIIWVKVPSIPSGDSRIIMYYGNPSATSESNGENVFIFFDDFNRADGTDLGQKWQEYGDGNWQIVNNTAYRPEVLSGSDDFALAKMNGTLLNVTDIIIESKLKVVQISGSDPHIGITARANDISTWPSHRGYSLTVHNTITTLQLLDEQVAWKASTTTSQALNEWWKFKLQVSGTTMKGKAWKVGTPEPDWMVSDSSTTQSSGYIGLDAYASGTTEQYYDDFFAHKYAAVEPTVSIESDSYSIYDSSLVLAMNFNNNSAIGENATKSVDISKYGNNGTINGGAVWTPNGRFGSALSFDGVNDYVQIPRVVQDDFSILVWVKTTQTAGTGQWYNGNGIVDGEMCGVTNDFGVSLSGSKAAFGIGNPDTTIYSQTNINDGNWHFITATRQRSSGQIKIYVDGNLEATGTANTNSLTAPSWIGIGNNPCDVSNNRWWFGGTIDEVRIYNRALSADEVKMHYQSEFQKYNSTQYRFYVNITNISNGTYTYYAWANDTSGLSGQSEVRTLNVGTVGGDVTPPVISLLSPTEGAYLNSSTVTFSFNATDDTSSALNCSIYIDGNLNSTNTSVVNGSISSFIVSGLSDASHNWSINCNDAVPNYGISETRNFTVDTTAPSVSITSPASNAYFSQKTFTISGSSTDANLNYTNISIYQRNTLINSTVISSPAWNVQLSVPSDGVYNITATAYDKADNSNQSTIENIKVDTTSPILSFIPPTPANNANLTVNSMTVNVSSTENLSSCILNFSGTAYVMTIVNADTNTYAYYSLSGFDFGSYNYNVTCNDTVGNAASTETRSVNYIEYIEVSVSPTSISFGSVDPLSNTTSMTPIVVTNTMNSNVPISLSFNGSDFVSNSYSIGVGNLTMRANSVMPGAGNFTLDHSLSNIETACSASRYSLGQDCSNISIGSSINLWFNIRIPGGQPAATYNSTLTIKATGIR